MGPEGEDEPILLSLLSTNAYVKCKYPGEIPCREGHSKCYNLTDICIYRLNNNNHNIPCRTGDHLQNCKNFECDTTFKCEQSYCIPWSYVNDGKWDCPKGEEELLQSNDKENDKEIYNCIHLYKCRYSKICVHLASLCNNQIDCPMGDDEMLCGLKNTKCILFCKCLAYALHCKNIKVRIPLISYPFLSVTLVNIILLNDIFKYFPNSLYITLNRNGLTNVCQNFTLQSIVLLDIKFNKISYILTGCFISLFQLKAIYLDYNSIASVNALSFVNLSNLHVLSLSNNPLHSIGNIILNSPALKILSIRHIQLTNVFDLKHLKVMIFDTSDFHLCCIAPSHSQCSQVIPWFYSCTDLLPKETMKMSLFSMLILVFITNFISIPICMYIESSGKIFQKIMYSINFTDMTCVIYLSIIWFTDKANIGKFIFMKKTGGQIKYVLLPLAQ